jgi:hypothetical protein
MKIFIHHTKPLLSIILIIFFIGFISCTKEKKGKNYTAVYGEVLDYYTLEPISNVQINIHDGFLPTIYTGVSNISSTTYSDANGYYFIELENHLYDANFGVNKEGYNLNYFFFDEYNKSHSFPPGIYPNYTIRLKPLEDE